jgi:signal transduction histidine kinase/ligand-binding sensor domain-containing protein/CheY-like chemotaxis protein
MLHPFRILCSLLLFAVSALNGSPERKWISMNLTNEDGLFNSAITSIYQDDEGLMWFGSWDGLNRYDGTNMNVFKPDILVAGSISNNIIRNMLEDGSKRFWVVTNEGINRFEPESHTFVSYFYDKRYIPFKEQNLKACLGPGAEILVSLFHFGIYVYNPATKIFNQLKLPGLSTEAQKRIIGLSCGTNDKLYLLSDLGILYTFQKKGDYELTDTNTVDADPMELRERHWFTRGADDTFLSVAKGSGELMIINLETGEHNLVRKTDEHLSVTTVNAVPGTNDLWIGTDNGSIYNLLFRDGIQLKNMNDILPGPSINNVKIWTIKQTADGLLWIGTDGNGVFRYAKGKSFQNIKKGGGTDGSLGHNIVRSIYKDKMDNLWVGTRGDGINLLTANGNERISINMEKGLSNNAVLSLRMDDANNLWIGVDGVGIDMLEHSTGKIFHFPGDFTNAGEQSFGNVYAICMDVFGEIWLGTSGYGVVNLKVSRDRFGNYRLDKFNRYQYDPEGNGLRSDIVYAIVEESPNILWLGTRGGGLHRMNTLNNTFEIFEVTENHIDGLIDNDILSLCLTKDEKLCIGSSSGLSIMDLSFRPYRFTHYTERSGLPNNTVHGIMQDAEGNLWLSTNRGLSEFIPSTESFMNFNKADGLQNAEFTDGSFFNDTVNHLLYFGGTEGVDWFDPAEIETANHFPQIYLSEFRLNNSLVATGDSTGLLNSSLNNTNAIALKHNQNFFSFSYTTLNYFNPQKCQFAYYLEGFEEGWNYVGNRRTASFTNVPPGNYALKIMATNEDGIYGDEIREIAIQIHQPYWNSLPAYLVYIILLTSLAWLVVMFLQRRSQEHRKAETQKMDMLKAEEINLYKLQFFTNIAHEFRSPLTLILAPAAVLEEELGEKSWMGQYARSIFQNANRMQKLINELIEFRKVETKNMSLKVGRHELVQYIKKLKNAFELHAEMNNMELIFNPSKPVIEAWIDLEKFEKILINLVSNAIKHTPPGGEVTILLQDKDYHIELVVQDTGSGIPIEFSEKIFERFYHHNIMVNNSDISQESGGVGLSLTKSLVELHKGSIVAKNRPGKGSEFHVTIPNRREIYENELVENPKRTSSEKIAVKVAEEFYQPISFEKEGVQTNTSDSVRAYTVMVVDDNDEICNLVESLLVTSYKVIKVHNSKSALNLLSKEPVDLVISDVIMPGMDGLELTKCIKTDINTSHIPVILLTAKSELEDHIEGLEVGADAYIPKPFNPRHLKIRTEKLIANIERLRNTFKEYKNPPNGEELLRGLSEGDRKLITNLIEYIEDNMLNSTLSADHLTDHMAMSKTQLYRKIKALTGQTPHGLIKYLRIKKAASELKKREKTVSEIYYETGFNNRSYFYRSFKEAYGMSPGDYADEV